MRKQLGLSVVVAALSMMSLVAVASQDSIGPNGIDSDGLTLANGNVLTGSGVGIGQVEPFRPGRAGTDVPANLHPSVNSAAVFRQDSVANAADTDDHAQQVAGIMISTDLVAKGVSPSASLFASAYVTGGANPGYQDTLRTIQHVATQNGGAVAAVNHSWGKELPPAAVEIDGNTLLSLGMDWSARVHDVLHIVAGNEGYPGPLPTDIFNGLVVTASEEVGGVYRQVASFATFDDLVDERTPVSLMAPGSDIRSTIRGNQLTPPPSNPTLDDDGTSFAAPHVTGTVALLQQYANERINSVPLFWDGDARRHEVMKAVLMNSADKLIDDGTVQVNSVAVPQGYLLGMSRTVLDQNNMTWLDSEAADGDLANLTGNDPQGFYPLDDQMGAGHLNARRALEQFDGGEHEANAGRVPVQGWDFGTTPGEDQYNRYVLDRELPAGSFVSLTLAWDREVVFDIDNGVPGQYDAGDTFEPWDDSNPGLPPADSQMNDLTLWLLPKGSATINSAVGRAGTPEGTVEHMFLQVPTTGEYEIWVFQEDADVGLTQDYALAWWAVGSGPLLAGDFDGDSAVTLADYQAWRDEYGDTTTPGFGADGNGDGVVNAADYTVWRDTYVPASTAVPEPTAATLLAAALIAVRSRRRP
ncbi:MAG: S8 family serine peptidase [Lacipirellulaceae bacterium]